MTEYRPRDARFCRLGGVGTSRTGGINPQDGLGFGADRGSVAKVGVKYSDIVFWVDLISRSDDGGDAVGGVGHCDVNVS